MKTANRTTAEARRLARLHVAFLQARDRVAAGATITSELRRLHRRRLKREGCVYSVARLVQLFARWRRDPRTETLVRRYKPGRRRQLTARDTRGILRALQASSNLSIKAVCAAINHDRSRDERISVRAAYRMLRARLPERWTTLRRARLAAQREIARIDALLVDGEPEAAPRAPASVGS